MDGLAEHYGIMHLRDENWPQLPSSIARQQRLLAGPSPQKRTYRPRKQYADEHERAADEALQDIVKTLCHREKSVLDVWR